MTHEKKRPQIRESLTDEEELSGKGYYGETDIQRIIETFSPDPDFDRNAFVRRLEEIGRAHV
jgi:hypothetical protein